MTGELLEILMDECKDDAERIVVLCDEALGLETNEVMRWTAFRHLELIRNRAKEIARKLTA
jgi:hypothetical protein